MRSDNAVPMPIMGTVVFVSKTQYRDWLTTALVTGKIDARQGAAPARQVGDLKRSALRLLESDNQALHTRMAGAAHARASRAPGTRRLGASPCTAAAAATSFPASSRVSRALSAATS